MTSSQAQSSDRLHAVTATDAPEGTDTTEAVGTEAGAPPSPAIEVLGDATPEQVAALVAVLSGLGGGDEAPPAQVSRWASRERLVRREVHPGPGGWRASGLPR